MKKKIVLLSAVLLIAIASAFAINGNLFSNQQAEALQFLVTVYQYGGGSTQSNAEIEVVDSNNGWILSGTTDSNGVYSCLWPGSWSSHFFPVKTKNG